MLRSTLVYELTRTSYLLIPEKVVQIFESRRQVLNEPESGGILLGKHYVDESIEVTAVTEPFADDVRRRYSFERRSREHTRVAKRQWKRSGEITTYVGEWHTHPETNAQPSRADFLSWAVALEEMTALVFVIGTESNWIGRCDQGRPTKLRWVC